MHICISAVKIGLKIEIQCFRQVCARWTDRQTDGHCNTHPELLMELKILPDRFDVKVREKEIKKDILLSALALFLVAACLCLTEGRSHGNAKMSALIKRLEMALAPNKAVLAGEAVVADVQYDGQCDDQYGDDGIKYWCPTNDKCCPHPANNGDDGDYVCCQPDADPAICASIADACYW